MANQKQELKIDLDKIMNPNPNLVKAYKDANALSISFELGHDGEHYNSPEFTNERRIFTASSSSKVPIRHNIFAVYRRKVGSKEYCYFFDLMMTKDYFANPVDHTRLCGKYTVPEIVTRYAINPSVIRSDSAQISPVAQPPEIVGNHEVYEYEWNAIVPQLRKWWESGVIPRQRISML
jgi:hypothetical protein